MRRFVILSRHSPSASRCAIAWRDIAAPDLGAYRASRPTRPAAPMTPAPTMPVGIAPESDEDEDSLLPEEPELEPDPEPEPESESESESESEPPVDEEPELELVREPVVMVDSAVLFMPMPEAPVPEATPVMLAILVGEMTVAFAAEVRLAIAAVAELTAALLVASGTR